MKKIAVLLSGCGVYDGAEIQESVLTLLAIAKEKGEYHCFAPNISQHHVINHLNGEEINQTRNVLVEAARIARGSIRDLKEYKAAEFDALVIPGGFGVAKNLSKWAFEGPKGAIEDSVKNAILQTLENKKAIVALCMGPTAVAKALEGQSKKVELSVGTDQQASPYDIKAISEGINQTGAVSVMKKKNEIAIDKTNRIISAPCYMMENDIVGVNENIEQAIKALFQLI